MACKTLREKKGPAPYRLNIYLVSKGYINKVPVDVKIEEQIWSRMEDENKSHGN